MSKKLTISPLYDEIFLEITQAKLGGLNTSSLKTGVERGTIIALGPDVENKSLKVGTKVHVKAWGVDIIEDDGETYHYTSEARRAIKAIIN